LNIAGYLPLCGEIQNSFDLRQIAAIIIAHRLSVNYAFSKDCTARGGINEENDGGISSNESNHDRIDPATLNRIEK
jgi:hypothetical protein